ncbi:hypothetical protein D3C73_1573240 [compost metagenome]
MNGRVIDANAPEGDVDAPAFQRLHLLQRGHLVQAQFQLAVLAQLADQLRQHLVQGRGGKADP